MTSMLIDSHCHLNCLKLEQLGYNLDELISRTMESGISHMLCISITLEEFPQVLKIAHTYPNIFASVGVHPNEPDCIEPSVNELVMLASDPDIIAIGETGLDYFRSNGDLEWQRQRFRTHIRAALEANKPLIIHTRDAELDTISILKEEGAAAVGGVMHCFTGSIELAKAALELGFYISFSGIITFKNTEELQEVARQVPDERFLVETDSPYLTPVPLRGRPNQPANTRYVAEKLAEIRQIPVALIAEQSTRNFIKLFNCKL